MPRDLLASPFKDYSNAKPDFPGLGKSFLSAEDVEHMRELDRPASLAPRPTSGRKSPLIKGDLEGFRLTDAFTPVERGQLEKEKELRKTRQNLIKWADEYGFDGENWVDEEFDFNPDGTAVCNGALNISGLGVEYLPKGLVEVRGNLDLSHTPLKNLKDIPKIIGGSLVIVGCENLIDLNDLIGCTIQGDLELYQLPTAVIPKGINLKGFVWVRREEADLIRSIKAAGYRVVF
jgi:hypothetical protein